MNTPLTHQGGLADLKRLRPFRRPLKRRRIIRFVTFQNECQLSYNLGLEGIEIFMVSTVFSGLLHHEDSWLRCFEIVPKSLYNLPKLFKNRLKIVVCGGALWRLEGVLGRLGASWSILGCLEGVLRASWRRLGASWRRLGASWRRLGTSWRRLGASWRRLGGVLEASWGRLGSF